MKWLSNDRVLVASLLQHPRPFTKIKSTLRNTCSLFNPLLNLSWKHLFYFKNQKTFSLKTHFFFATQIRPRAFESKSKKKSLKIGSFLTQNGPILAFNDNFIMQISSSNLFPNSIFYPFLAGSIGQFRVVLSIKSYIR